MCERGLFAIISLTVIYVREAAAGLDDAHHKEQHQQGAANGLGRPVDAHNHVPDGAALEVFRSRADERPDPREFAVPRLQRGVQIVYDPVSTAYFLSPHDLQFEKNEASRPRWTAGRFFDARGEAGSSCIGVGCVVCKVLFFKPKPFFFRLRNIDPLNFENDRPGAIIAAGDHHAFVICPFVHNGAALQRGVNISADRVPRLAAEFSIHQMIEVIAFSRSFQNKCISSLVTIHSRH